MKKMYILLLILVLSLSLAAQINGELTQNAGKWTLRTWGTHSERGYAQGYLLAEPMMSIFNGYFFQMVAMSNPTVYNSLLSFYQTHFSVEQKYHAEAQGIVNGIIASGVNPALTGLSRNVTADDILLANCLVDMYSYREELRRQLLHTPGFTLPTQELELGCASLSSWGSATLADTLLAGSSVISRFMDWNSDVDLIANPLLLINFPSETNEQPWLSFTYPGMFGALSGISASGKAAFLNMGNVHSYDNLTNLHPILFSIRNAIESSDFNADGADDITDVFDAVFTENSLSGSIIHTVSETDDIMAGIIETNNQNGTVMRTVGVNSGVPGMNLAATNHFRMLASPVCCSRYANIIDSLAVNPDVSAKRQIRILTGAAGQDNNMMAMQYIPSTGNLRWSTSTLEQPAFQTEVTNYLLSELLDLSTSIQENLQLAPITQFTVYPNPTRSGSRITIIAGKHTTKALYIYNLKGQQVAAVHPGVSGYIWNGSAQNGEPVANGLYLLQAQTETGGTISGKVLIIR